MLNLHDASVIGFFSLPSPALAESNPSAYNAAMRDIIDPLRAQQTDFHTSLADQLLDGSLSDRQACYAVKAILGRETKKNADDWWALYERCTAPVE